MNVELLIEHQGKIYGPPIVENIIWTTERRGVPGQLTFTFLYDGINNFSEGDSVRLQVDDIKIFYGFIFTLQANKDRQIKVTAYDQLRYLKNKHTYVYKNKTAEEVIRMIASDFNLKTGKLEDTKYKIASRVEDNVTLFDVIQNALNLTLQSTGDLHVMYDNFGKIALHNIKNMQLDYLINEETAQDYDFSSSIDSETYNKIKLTKDNNKTGKRDVYIVQDSKHINDWGVLQYFNTLQNNENGKTKANALLKLYNQKTRNLTIKDAFGDGRIRAGCMIGVIINSGLLKIKKKMLIEKCSHIFKNQEHTMNLTLIGGGFNA